MAPAQPKRKSSELIDKLNELNKNFNEFELRKVIFDAKKIKDIEPARAYMVLGMAESMIGNEEESIRYFNAAAQLSSDTLIATNRSKGYSRFYRLTEALDIVLAAHRTDPSDLKLLQDSIDAAWRVGNIEVFFSLLKALTKMAPQLVDKYEAHASIFDSMSEELKRDLQGLCAEVEKVLRENKTMGFSWKMIQEDDGITYMIAGVRADPDKVAKLNMEIADWMAAKDNNHSNEIIFLCRPAE